MLEAFQVPIGWGALLKRTYNEIIADKVLGLAAQLAYYFFLALFPALLFLVAVLSFVPVENLMDTIVNALARVAPSEVLTIVQRQILDIANNQNGGLLTLGMLGTIWSTSAGVLAIIDTLNQTYDIEEGRPWWKVRLTALGLTIALAIFIVAATVLVVAGPALADRVASSMGLGEAFAWTWKIAQWPVVFVLVATGIAMIYYYAPDADQDWVWITPGSIGATVLWVIISLGFRFYVTNFGSYNATYGAITGVVILMLWFYMSALAVLVGAELNAEIEHASPHGKDPGEKVPGEKKKIGARARRAWEERQQKAAARPAAASIAAMENCDVEVALPPAAAAPRRSRASEWVLSGIVLGQAAVLSFLRIRKNLNKTPS